MSSNSCAVPRAILRVALTCLSLASWAQAQTLKDPALEALYVAERSEELQHAAAQRLATRPDDTQAVLALTLASLQRDDAGARAQALTHARACAEKPGPAQACLYAHGVLLGIQSMSEGLGKALRSAGAVRDALVAAHEADPAWYPARSALVEFYLAAPGLLGGSSTRAGELARMAPQSAQAAALKARIALQEKRFEAALQDLQGLPSGLEFALAADVRGWGTQAGLGLVNAGQAAKALPFFERLLREQPGQAHGPYGLARVRGEQGDWAEALRLYELCAGLKGASAWPLDYRIGIAQQRLGRTEAAKASLQRFVVAGKGQKASLEDARKRLEQLGS